MNQMVMGQHYRVSMKSVSKDGTERRTTEYLVIGSSCEDVKGRFPYIVDLSEFSRYNIEYIVKDPDRVHVLRSKLEISDPNAPDINIEREFGTQGFWQQVSGASNSKKWSVVAKTVCFAKNPRAAASKLALRISEGSGHVDVVTEELALDDGFAKPKDMSVFHRASFVRG